MTRGPFIHFLLALVLLLGAAATYGIWYGMVGKASALSAGLASAIETKSKDAARVAAAKAALDSLASDEATLERYFIRTDDIVPFLERLESLGSALGASVEVVSVSANATGAHEHISLSLRIDGSFDSVLRTLGSIEYGPYDSRLQSVTFNKIPGSTDRASSWSASAVFLIGTKTASKP